ncbi:MAG: EFR1 family ferrodoxin [Thermoplasmata archaeon]|nr:EFR1 family ferrodoxin [Thermoplasmata archaeon]
MIFVFSGTGNSFDAAKRISGAGIGGGLVDMAPRVRYKRYSYDAAGEDVGFVFPVYFYGLPSIVKEFASNVTVKNPGRVFCVATCGEESGGAGEMLAECLGDRLKVDAFHDVVMPDNSVFMFDAPTKEQVDATMESAGREIDAIIASLKAGESGDLMRHKGDRDWREIYPQYDEYRVTEPFRATDKCIQCRICEELCPEQAIMFYHRTPVWDEEKCCLCMGCLQLCPKAAIEYGEGTESRGRYWNPVFYEKTLGLPFKYDE